jgi:hypothetical protein
MLLFPDEHVIGSVHVSSHAVTLRVQIKGKKFCANQS